MAAFCSQLGEVGKSCGRGEVLGTEGSAEDLGTLFLFIKGPHGRAAVL